MTQPEMPFLEHLQELRSRLIISLIALFIGMALAWTFALSALTVIQRPLAQPSLIKRLQYDLVSRVQKSFPQIAEQICIWNRQPWTSPSASSITWPPWSPSSSR